ncbi:MAG: hypothetical protein ACREQJ_13535 [Candidatus Binatia bacterium]
MIAILVVVAILGFALGEIAAGRIRDFSREAKPTPADDASAETESPPKEASS